MLTSSSYRQEPCPVVGLHNHLEVVFLWRLLSVSCVLATLNPFGEVRDGYIDLKTRVFPAVLCSQDNRHTIVGQEVAREDRGQRVMFSNPNIGNDQGVSIDTSENAFTPEQQVTCAVLYQASVSSTYRSISQSFYVLVLERGDSGTDTFKRIGIAHGAPVDSRDMSLLLGPTTTIRIF